MAQYWTKTEDKTITFPAPKAQKAYDAPIGPERETTGGKVSRVMGSIFGKARDFAENHPSNHPAPRGRSPRADPAPRGRAPRTSPAPMGSMGGGFNMDDFIPNFGPAPEPHRPSQSSKPKSRKKKPGKREPAEREDRFDPYHIPKHIRQFF